MRVSITDVAKAAGVAPFTTSRALSDHPRISYETIVVGSQINLGYLKMRDRLPPLALTNCPTYPYSISCDNVAGARRAVEHLWQLGHQRIRLRCQPAQLQQQSGPPQGLPGSPDRMGSPWTGS